MNELIIIVKDIGFPIFVAVFCLFRLDKRLKEICCEVKKLNSRGGV
jgi:hypothetical protein